MFASTKTRRSPWLTVAALVVVFSTTVMPPSVAFARGGSQPPAGPKPTIVLVHGAWADASSWDGVIRRLQDDGYVVTAPPNPLRGLPFDTAYLSSYLATISGPVVLVGHSYGGAVITDAATGNPNARRRG